MDSLKYSQNYETFLALKFLSKLTKAFSHLKIQKGRGPAEPGFFDPGSTVA